MRIVLRAVVVASVLVGWAEFSFAGSKYYRSRPAASVFRRRAPASMYFAPVATPLAFPVLTAASPATTGFGVMAPTSSTALHAVPGLPYLVAMPVATGGEADRTPDKSPQDEQRTADSGNRAPRIGADQIQAKLDRISAITNQLRRCKRACGK